MATYTAAAGDRAVHDKTLVAATVDTVSFPDDAAFIEVIASGADIYFTNDGSTPTVSGANTYKVIDGTGLTVPMSGFTIPSVIKLISAGTPSYSVTRGGS